MSWDETDEEAIQKDMHRLGEMAQKLGANPLEGKVCAIFLKSSMVFFQGQITTAAPFLETRILKWMREGIMIENRWSRAKESFMPWNNIEQIAPLEGNAGEVEAI